MAARIGDDEFALVAVVDIADAFKQASELAERLRNSLQIIIEVPGELITNDAGIDFAVYPKDGDNINNLMKSADAAMYDAKNGGRNQARFFDPPQNQ